MLRSWEASCRSMPRVPSLLSTFVYTSQIPQLEEGCSTMICLTCHRVLRGQQGRQRLGTFDLYFDHHTARSGLEQSAAIGCYICNSIWEAVVKIDQVKNMKHTVAFNQSDVKTRRTFISAHLSSLEQKPEVYRLDFIMVSTGIVRTFLLPRVPNEAESQRYTPLTENTKSEEVLQLARFWLRRCISSEHEGCPNEDFSNRNLSFQHTSLASWHDRSTKMPPKGLLEDQKQSSEKIGEPVTFRPTRLLDLRYQEEEENSGQEMWQRKLWRRSRTLSSVSEAANSEREDNIRLIETMDLHVSSNQPQEHYVTLSHCWGDAQFTCLRKNSLQEFHVGIALSSLPQTFRHAIDFARRLSSSIRYMWIDSLCIVQDDPEDWVRESVQMCEVYRNSYCNISATAATDSAKGLYFDRDPQWLWENEINLNIDEVSRAWSRDQMIDRERKHYLGPRPLVQRCEIRDLSFWDRKVEDAPVNRRAWVVQERLLSPRVIHFCDDQIAFECRHLEAAESLPYGVSEVVFKSGDIRDKVRLKALVSVDYGPKPIKLDPTEVSDATHDTWKLIVERYSTTRLTEAKDRLIAIVGVAQMMSSRILGNYVVGFWERYFASQLLWRVEPVYDAAKPHDEQFAYPSRRIKVSRLASLRLIAWQNAHEKDSIPLAGDLDELTRECGMTLKQVTTWFTNARSGNAHLDAPSFSWAAIDAPQGIKCAETRPEKDLHISVEHVNGVSRRGSQNFGLAEKHCFVELTCALKEIRIFKDHGRYAWSLLDDGDDKALQKVIPSVYPDAPDYDFDDNTYPGGRIYCVPFYKNSANYLICMLLRETSRDEEYYCRIGVTMIPYFEKVQNAIWAQTKMKRRIRII